ncbi:hypothetical protein HIM_02401 [Hirsutella minnesotensis 3608]|nr:hypothetical protein HIM_02401 [Hirsutella minnesotensis 3608]
MSYQYMAPPTNQAAIDMSQPVYSAGFKLPSQDPSIIDADCKDSEGSYDEQKPTAALRRSFSTPNTAQIQQSAQEMQAQNASAGEKKRNKLGYHRTSIACSHCRRRKIRCIASQDVQNRCVNCIRLKKECSFYPVDQQPGGESRSRGPARQPAGSSVASTNSSPAVAAGSPGEMHHAHAPVSGISQGGKSQTGADELYPPDAKVPSNGVAAGQYSFVNQPQSGWMTDMNSTAKSEGLNMSWHSYAAESPISTQFSPYPQSSAASATWASGNSEAGSHDDMPWSDFPPPTRSMSLSGESSESHQQLQYMSVGQGTPYDRRQSTMSDMYPQPYGVPVANMTSGAIGGIDAAPPMVAGTLPSNAESWQQPLLSQGQNPYGKQGAVFDGWQGGHQRGWLDDHRSKSNTAQGPPESYYST